MKNLEIAKLFERAADALALLEENGFKVLAYRKIARALEEMAEREEKMGKSLFVGFTFRYVRAPGACD